MTSNAFAATGERTLLVFGDSLSAAYGLRADQGWVAQLQKRLGTQGYGYRVVNASVNDETTSGGRSRLQRALASSTNVLTGKEMMGCAACRSRMPKPTWRR